MCLVYFFCIDQHPAGLLTGKKQPFLIHLAILGEQIYDTRI